jgi:hypothetical protein
MYIIMPSYILGPWNGKYVYVYLFRVNLENFTANWYIFGHLVNLRYFSIFFPGLVFCIKKIMATL